MRRFSILSATSIAALSAWTFVAFATPASAHTYEHCRRDTIGYTLSCGFDSVPCRRASKITHFSATAGAPH
jgi:hypothetical protein